MKPIIIIAQDENKITLTKAELEKYLQEAYNEGYQAGRGSSYPIYIDPSPKLTPLVDPSYPNIVYCDSTKDFKITATKTAQTEFEKDALGYKVDV